MSEKKTFEVDQSLADLGRPIRIDSINDNLFVNLFISLNFIKIKFDNICVENGITGPQYNLLRTLQSNNGKATMNEIYSGMLSQDAGVTRLTDRLIEKGFAKRRRGIKDRRIVYVTITKEGDQFANTITRLVASELDSSLAHMNRKEIEQLIYLLSKIRQPDNSSIER